MAREHDGTDDYLTSPADAVGNVGGDVVTFCAWVYKAGNETQSRVVTQTHSGTSSGGRRRLTTIAPTTSGVRFAHQQVTSGTEDIWATPDQTTGWHSVVATRDRSAGLATGPNMWVDGGSVTPTNTTTGSGTASTGDDNVSVGATMVGASDFLGRTGHIALVSSAVSDAGANRFHWWGATPGGPSTMAVWLPLWTDNVRNKGTGGDHAYTVNGTTMVALPKIERCWAAAMGVGR